MKINPTCFKKNNFFFVRPDGSYIPCCYTSACRSLLDFLGPELYSQLNLNNYTFEQVVNSEAYNKIIDMVKSDNPLQVCLNTCPLDGPGHRAVVDEGKNIHFDGLNKSKLFGNNK